MKIRRTPSLSSIPLLCQYRQPVSRAGCLLGLVLAAFAGLPAPANAQVNTATGSGALHAKGSGSHDTATGYDALYENTTGTYNTATGAQAMEQTTTGSYNSVNGALSLFYNSTGAYNSVNGAQSLYYNTTGSFNSADGAQVLYNNTTGGHNTGVGSSALYDNTTGNFNTAVGYTALYSNNTGKNNSALGNGAMYLNTDGTNNLALGVNALGNATTPNNNIVIGYGAGINLVTSRLLPAVQNNIEIGSPGAAGDNATIRIGTTGSQNAAYIAGIGSATVAGGVAVYVNPTNGQLGVLTSSARFKKDIQNMNDASDTLLALRPVTFRYKSEIDPKGVPQYGLVAEDVAKVNPNLVVRDDKNQIYTVRYEAVNAMLLNEFLKEHKTVEDQKSEIQNLKQSLEELKGAVRALAEKK